VTENNRRRLLRIAIYPQHAAVRVKRRGKSSPGPAVMSVAARLMGCKVKYTGI